MKSKTERVKVMVGSAVFIALFGATVMAAVNTDTVTATNWVRQTSGAGPNYFMGNVGIGVTSPSSKLDVKDTGNTLVTFEASSGNYVELRLLPILNDSYLSWGDGVSDYPLSFWSYYLNGEVMNIQGDGRVGIGISIPTAQLEVSGVGGSNVDFKVNGRLQSGNNDGGLYVGTDNTRFFGGVNTNKIGLYNGGWRLMVGNIGNIAMGIGTASGTNAVSEGYSVASGPYSHAESASTATGLYSHAEGEGNWAWGEAAHAEGIGNYVTIRYGHSEGYYTEACGDLGSHAEGYDTQAVGTYSHAEGESSETYGAASHAAGAYAFADHNNTYVWSDGTAFNSTTNRQFSVCATNGIRLLGGPTVGVRGGDISMGIYTNMPPQ